MKYCGVVTDRRYPSSIEEMRGRNRPWAGELIDLWDVVRAQSRRIYTDEVEMADIDSFRNRRYLNFQHKIAAEIFQNCFTMESPKLTIP